MKFYTYPKWARWFQKGVSFQGPDNGNAIYFTFDDGPDPESLPYILEILKQYDAKATFFCLGEKLERYPELKKKMQDDAHQIGNHGYRHLDAIKYQSGRWIDNALQGQELCSSDLFRPPYGHIRIGQKRKLLQSGIKIILWDLMLYDYHEEVSAEKMWQIFSTNVKPASIIVLHDKLRTIEKMKVFLPQALEYCQKKSWEARILPDKTGSNDRS